MKKILIVVTSLQEAGAEKYAYELAKSLDKTKFNVEILTTDDVFYNLEFPHVYYEKLIDLGIKVNTFLFKPKEKKIINSFFSNLPLIKYLLYRYNRFIRNTRYKKKLKKIFQNHDIISLIDAPQYYLIKDYITSKNYLDIHLMCHQLQFKNGLIIYKDFEEFKPFNFVYIDDVQIIEAKNQNVQVGNIYKLPLSLEFDNFALNEPQISYDLNIAVFTRVSYNKPMNKIIDAFSELIKMNSDYRLFIFGYIQEKEYYSELLEEINKLGLNDKIFFMGHSSNMYKSCIENRISLIWVISIYDFIGYAALELCIKNIPIVLSNLYSDNELKLIDDKDCIPPYFYDSKELAIYTNYLLENNLLNELLVKEKNKYLSEHNLIKNVSNYEEFLLNVT
ncbi:glycosyltransferase [Empedobacter falsenii]